MSPSGNKFWVLECFLIKLITFVKDKRVIKKYGIKELS